MSTKIVQFNATKVKRIEAVDITFKENGATIIGGANAQGKTTVLDMIMAAIKGKKYEPTQPIKDGAERGEVKIALNNGVTIRRRFTEKGSTIAVEGSSGSPQTFLNELFGEHALDVREFMQSTDKAKTLMKICGLDFTQIDAEYKRLYDERTLANRDADRAKKLYEGLPKYGDVPEQEVNTADLIRQITELTQRKTSLGNEVLFKKQELDVALFNREQHAKELAQLKARVAEMEKITIPANEQTITELTEAHSILEDDFIQSCFDDQIEHLQTRISGAEETNQKVRTNAEKQAAHVRMDEAVCEANSLDEQVKANREQKDAMLESARFPLAGLSIADGIMTYKGRPWDGLSTAEQFMVGTAIQAALKPDAPIVLLDHMEAFDQASLAKFCAWCEQKGFQVIGTRVSTGDECDVIIEDGSVRHGS